jgi:hypothetical protein
MKTIWTLTKPYLRNMLTDSQIIQAKETHKSLKKIMLYIMDKLAKMVFADELRARREAGHKAERDFADELRARREDGHETERDSADELRARREAGREAEREHERASDRERERVRREAEEIESREAIALANRLGVNIVNINRSSSTTVRYLIDNSTVVSRVVRDRYGLHSVTDSDRDIIATVLSSHIYVRPPLIRHCNIENSLRNITEEEADKEMEDDCAICASKHKMADVCAIDCGHQFGMDCLTPWINILKNAHKHPTCPCCRAQIKKIVQYSISPC